MSFVPSDKTTGCSIVDMGTFQPSGSTINANDVTTAKLTTHSNGTSARNGVLNGMLYGPSAGELGLNTQFSTCSHCLDIGFDYIFVAA